MGKESLFRLISKAGEIEPREKVPELRRVPADKAFHGPLLCDGVFAIPLHWTGQRRQRCYEASGFCAHCASCPRCDTFLVAIWDKNERRAIWAELTDHSADNLVEALAELQKPFYRTVVKISRERKTLKAPIVVEVDQWATVATKLPAPMLPDDTIIRVFESVNSTRRRKKKPVS
jgi:hypothetical protein